MGATKLWDTEARKCGRFLKSEVARKVKKERKNKIKECGLKFNPNYPVMGASPDGEDEV